MQQLDLLSWTPPKPKRKSRRSLDNRPCRCGRNIGFCRAWHDAAGFEHVECEACSPGPRMPYWRPAPTVYSGSYGELDAFDAIHGGGFA